MPRYFPGRKCLVRTTVDADPTSSSYMSYKSNGDRLVTHQAILVGKEGDNFLA